jgi:hypothetical protein
MKHERTQTKPLNQQANNNIRKGMIRKAKGMSFSDILKPASTVGQ